jgi:hypothetical protein
LAGWRSGDCRARPPREVSVKKKKKQPSLGDTRRLRGQKPREYETPKRTKKPKKRKPKNSL